MLFFKFECLERYMYKSTRNVSGCKLTYLQMLK